MAALWEADKSTVINELDAEVDWMINKIYFNSEPVREELVREIERRLWMIVGLKDHSVAFKTLYELYCEQRR